MNSETENTRKVVQAMYQAALAGDMAGATATMAEDLIVHEPLFLPWGGISHGKQAFIDLLGRIGTHLDMSSLILERLVVDGDMAVSYMSGTTHGGRYLLASERSTVRDGKIVEITVFYHDAGELVPAIA